MNLTSRISIAVLAVALPALAQTAAEQLQKGIFAQEAQGKVDDAITIYRQLANSTLTPREIAAQAQFRLTQSLLQKGDVAMATREMERLERDFAEYGNLISSLAASKGGGGVYRITPPPPVETLYNMASVSSARGKVKQLAFINPVSWLTIDVDGKDYRIQLTSPNDLFRSGVTKDTFKLGDEVTAQGPGAIDGSSTILGNQIMSANGQVLFDRTKVPPPPSEEDRKRAEEAMTQEALRKARESVEALHKAQQGK